MNTWASIITMTLNDRNYLWKKKVFYVQMSNLLTWRGRDLWYISQPAFRVRSRCFGFTPRSCHVVHLNICQRSISARCVVTCFCCPQMAQKNQLMLSVLRKLRHKMSGSHPRGFLLLKPNSTSVSPLKNSCIFAALFLKEVIQQR